MVLTPGTSLSGRRIVVTAGPTYEDIDPVRYIGNRSSGRMGFAIAAEAARRGAAVTLVAGPTSADEPSGPEIVRVRSAEDMYNAVLKHSADADAVIMAAAVADYTPEVRANQKVSKGDGDITLVLKRTPDILRSLGERRTSTGRPLVLVGFAAETQNVIARAAEKLRAKRVDLIVANDVSRADAGFDVDTNEVTLVSANGIESVPLQLKAQVAGVILDRIEQLLASQQAVAAKQ
jgi:phosphopantothenoylcysteine decarboxylase/phosphopantothenate--cysteine ligase